jgi:hypothetical protein
LITRRGDDEGLEERAGRTDRLHRDVAVAA